MFKPKKISKISLFFEKNQINLISKKLYELNLLEFFDIEHQKLHNFEIEEHEKSDNDTKKLLELKILKNELNKFVVKRLSPKNLDSENEILKKLNLFKEINKKIKLLEINKKNFDKAKILKITESDLKHKSIFGFVKFKHRNNVFKLKEIDSHINFIKDDNKYFFKSKNKKLDINLFSQIHFTKESLHFNEKKLILYQKEIKQLKKDLENIANNNILFLEEKEYNLERNLEIKKVKKDLKRTATMGIITGFLKKEDVKSLKNKLESLKINYELEISAVTKNDNVPTILNNPKFMKGFENLTKMYSLPKYGEFDPTIVLFLIFPLFYGFILGDVGYGILSFLVFYLIQIIQPELKSIMKIFQISSISSILFGWIYGEFLGFEPAKLLFLEAHTHYGWFIRFDNAETLLVIALSFGLIHINLALILALVKNIKNIKKVLADSISWFFIQIGIVMIYFIGPNYYSYVLFLLALIFIYRGHGFIGLLEVPSFFTSIFSYARLMAVGISSIVIAVLINEYTLKFFEDGVLGIVIGLFIFTLGHIFNIIIGNFESFLHSLRLNYVEHFSKYYTGGGREFKPFGKRRKNEK